MKTWKILLAILVTSVIATLLLAFAQYLFGVVNLLAFCIILMPFMFYWAKRTES
jgi:hypothetical protein